MKTYNIFTDKEDSLPEGRADFILAASVTKTCEIEGITQAGIPGKIPYTPTLDAEFVDSGKLFSLDNLAKTPKGVPTPAIITRAVKQLTNFKFETLEFRNFEIKSNSWAREPHVSNCGIRGFWNLGIFWNFGILNLEI